jgi:putative intracellular protease/amidase
MKVGIVVFEGFDELDAVGPYEVLRTASQHGAATFGPDGATLQSRRGGLGARASDEGAGQRGRETCLALPTFGTECGNPARSDL